MKTAYRELCEHTSNIPLFSQDWWLDAVAGEDWDVALVEKGGQVVASLPYVYRKKRGFRTISMPPLTQSLGPWLRPSDAKIDRQLGQQKELMNALIDQLPQYDYFLQNWHHTIQNWLPFHWRGYSQTSRVTYQLPDLNDVDALWSGLSDNTRKQIRKARNKFGLTLEESENPEQFFELNEMVFARQGRRTPYSRELVKRIDDAASQRNSRRILIARDKSQRPHAGVYLVWDKNSAYYLMGGGDPALRNSGASSLCMWEAIQFSSGVSQRFDFEGSMIEPIERFVRSFGAQQVQYHQISRTPSRLLRLRAALR